MKRVLVVGMGSIGRRHAQNLVGLGIEELALLRRRPETVAELPSAPVFTSLETALEWGPEAVVVCTPAPFHLEVARAAVARGCAVFIEKPLSASWDGVPELVREVSKRSAVVMLGFDLRFDVGLLRMRELVTSGELGRPMIVEAVVGQYLPDWRPAQDYRAGVTARAELGGGVLLELCHELDAASWMVGPVATVSCETGHLSRLEMDVEDAAVLLLRFDGGALGSIVLDCVRRPPTRTMRVVGERGTAVWDGLGRTLDHWDSASGNWQRFEFGQNTRDRRLQDEMAGFLECVAGRQAPPVDLRAGANVLRVVLAARRSAELGVRVAPAEIGSIPA